MSNFTQIQRTGPILAWCLGILFIPCFSHAQTPDCSEIYISEHIDGTGHNKVVEIYNPTPDPIDLSAYSINVYHNGAPTPQTTVLSGLLAPGKAFLLMDPGADASLLAHANATSVHFKPNGDDAIALKKGSVLLDIVGEIGISPGNNGWTTSGGGNTKNSTLVRKRNCTHGETDWNTCRNQWLSFPVEDYRHMGGHSSRCITTFSFIEFEISTSSCDEDQCSTPTIRLTCSDQPTGVIECNMNLFGNCSGAQADGADATLWTFLADFTPTNWQTPINIDYEVYADTQIEQDECNTIGFTIGGTGGIDATYGTNFEREVRIINDDFMGLADLKETLGITVSPTPTISGNNLVLDLSRPHKIERLRIVNALGQVTFEILPKRNRYSVSTETWTQGIYVLQAIGVENNISATMKLLVR